MESNKSNTALPAEQFALRDVLVGVLQIKNAIKKNWKLLVGFIAAGVFGGLIFDLVTKERPVYTASIIFNMGGAAPQQGGFGDISSLLGRGGGGAAPDAGLFVGENFYSYALSRPVIEKALMKTVKVNEQKLILANFYKDSSEFNEEFIGSPELLKVKFTNKPVSKLNYFESIVLDQMYGRIKGQTLLDIAGKKVTFSQLTVGIENETLARVWAETLIQTIEEVHDSIQTQKSRETLVILKNRADSLFRILNRTETRLAASQTVDMYAVMAESKMAETQLARKSGFVSTMYFEAIRSYENLRVSLIKETPLFTIIEPVHLPLVSKQAKGNGLPIGSFLGVLLGLIAIYVKTLYQQVKQMEIGL